MVTTRQAARGDSFDIHRPRLKAILDDIHDGLIRLPHFHRDWLWSSDDIRDLLESIADGHPIGVPILVDALSTEHRAISGAPAPDSKSSSLRLVLDGQQRLTAAYQACYMSAPVRIQPTKKRGDYCLYFFAMEQAVSTASRANNAIFSIRVGSDGRWLGGAGHNYTDPRIQYEHGIFPANQLFKFDSYETAYTNFWDVRSRRLDRPAAMRRLRDFRSVVVSAVELYSLPVQIGNRPVQVDAMYRMYERLNGVMGEAGHRT
ncbi:DUF262 domain-containing protein [Tardiphaga sp. 804_B3_N1_9]|uniref:DUF262 domain-containing protein n=1 Tax=Tardiphaga TaxID=1395974 RepID=UPI0015863343|nr:DUF262 domain-containing protein [Tardiphaga robiniae]NUU44626.1 DUF262 domain-containing protein [Tardiphaga robiniae]